MEARSTDTKTFQLTDNGQLLGELIYKNLFSDKAVIRLTNSEEYEIKPVGIFGTSITVTKNETEIASLKMNWRGQIVISFQDGQAFILKAKGTFYNKFIIENKDEERMIQFDPQFNWSKFNLNYEISFDKKPDDILFILLGVYASNYFIATMTGVVACTV
ncbi:MAG: hypothetical protein LC117_06110 [Bacteroidia bacterium]|nr:hypothetical protein [Bacteroidia bacterium]MCZ2277484.1 hypothetical protein [Bacteroidia bacterium]